MISVWNGKMPYACESSSFEPYITEYLVEDSETAILICPGGGYEKRTTYEGEDYARWLNAINISAFVLEYRVSPDKAPAPMADAQRAMRVVKQIGESIGIKRFGIMGSSAGGHLAAISSVHYDHPFYEPLEKCDHISARPDFTVLCYPVIDMGYYRHDPSRISLIGKRVTKDEIEFYSPHLHVTGATPPAFIWHCGSDKIVPAQNSLLYAFALAERNIQYDLHIYKLGHHGGGLYGNGAYVHQWADSLRKWINEM